MAATAAELAANSGLAHYEEILKSSEDEFFVHAQRGEFAARAVIGSRESLANARDVVAAAMENYVATARDVTVLERLDQRRREEHALAAQRAEAAEVDELVTVRHARQAARTQAHRRAKAGGAS